MRKRRRPISGDSFDLFLDTITNTFGGVLLIALLVILLVRPQADSGTERSAMGATVFTDVVQSEIEAMQAELEAIDRSMALNKQFENEFRNEEVQSLAATLAPLVVNRDQLRSEVASLEQESDRQENLKTLTESQMQGDASRLKQELEALAQLKSELAKEMSLRTRTMALPREQATTKREVPVLIEQNKMFFVLNKSGLLGSEINKSQFEVTAAADADIYFDSKYLKTRSGAGFPLGSGEMKASLMRHDPQQEYFAFVVRRDSFDQFSVVRDECVRNGFEYRLIPTDGMISESAGVGARTQ